MTSRPGALAFAAALLLAGCSPQPPTPRLVGRGSTEGATRAAGLKRHGAPVYRKEFFSPVFTIDRIYRSMMGPASSDRIALVPANPASAQPELLWLVGYHVDIVAPDGVAEASQEFMCHTNLEMDSVFYRERFPNPFLLSPRVFTLSQGQRSLELPDGFGVPVMSDQPFSVDTQVLNHNLVGRTLDVRHRVTIDFVRDRELTRPLVPVILQSVFGYVLVEGADGHFGLSPAEVDPARHGSGCLPGRDVGEAQGSMGSVLADAAGRRVSSHWLVKPGREENHSRVIESMMDLPYDTTVHYIAAHLHPFAESLELRDLTAGATVYKTRIRGVGGGRIGISEVEYFSSEEGLPLHRDHQYELVSVYDNTSGVDQDSMAVLFLYVRADHLMDGLRPG